MFKKTPSAFRNHDEWLAYVDRYVPDAERAYALAAGRTELLKRFYEIRRLEFPVEFATELDRIHDRADLNRPNDLEALNRQILGNLTVVLFNQAQNNTCEPETIASSSPRDYVRQLHEYIAKSNPYFRLWAKFSSGIEGDSGAGWDEYLVERFGQERSEEVEFAHAMVELDKLLRLFYDNNRALPRFSFERIWFLHYLRAPERMLQTRSVLTLLMGEISACTSA